MTARDAKQASSSKVIASSLAALTLVMSLATCAGCMQKRVEEEYDEPSVTQPDATDEEVKDPCGDVTLSGTKNARARDEDKSEAQADPSGDSANAIAASYGLDGWTDETYETAKELWESLTGTYGLSGACAAGYISNVCAESGGNHLAGEESNRYYQNPALYPCDFKNDADVDPPPGIAWYQGDENSVYGDPDYSVDHSGDPGWVPGGGGLGQETPYYVYTNWAKANAADKTNVWKVSNQVQFMMESSRLSTESSINPLGSYYGEFAPNFSSHMQWYTTDDAYQAAEAWQTCYLRGASWAVANSAPNRFGRAETICKMAEKEWNGGQVKAADEAKINSWFNKGGAPSDSATSSTYVSIADGGRDHEEQCQAQADGEVSTGKWLDQAKTYAADKDVGYSMDRRLIDDGDKDMDCSSFVWYSLTNCGVSGMTDATMGGAPFCTSNEASVLKSVGWVEHDVPRGSDGQIDYAQIPEGSVLLWDDSDFGTSSAGGGHTEFFLGKIDSMTGEKSDSGDYYTIGAHSNLPYGNWGALRSPSSGDQAQIANGSLAWLENEVNGQGQEVSATRADPTAKWVHYYTPDNVEGATTSDDGDANLSGDVASASEAAQAIVRAAQDTPSPGAGLCAAWVSNVYARAGVAVPGGNACDMYDQWCHSSNMSDLKPGMAVAIRQHSMTSAGQTYGHIGIYVGNGQIMDNIGYIRTEPVTQWINDYNAYAMGFPVRWGYAAPGI